MAVRFDAATDRVNYSGSGLPDPETAFTVTFWAYLSVDRDDFSAMARLSASSGASTVANISTHGSGTTLGYLTGGGSLVSGHALSAGAWSRVAATCTGTAGKIYGAAGAAGATDVVSGTVDGASTPDQLCLGGRSSGDSSEWFNGRLAHVRIWSTTVLTQAQIEAEWQSASPVITSGLVADWPLASASDLTDHSGNGRHLSAGSTGVSTEDGPPIGTTGALAASAPLPTTALAGDVVNPGALSASAHLPTTALAGTVTATGQLQASGHLPVAAVAGTVTAAGALATSAPLPTVAAAADVTASGALAVQVPPPVAALYEVTITWPPRATEVVLVPVATATVTLL